MKNSCDNKIQQWQSNISASDSSREQTSFKRRWRTRRQSWRRSISWYQDQDQTHCSMHCVCKDQFYSQFFALSCIAYLRTNFTYNFLNVSIVMFLFCKKRSGWRRRFWNWQVCKISEDDVGFDREARHQVQYVKSQQRKLRKILSLMLLCWSERIEFLAV